LHNKFETKKSILKEKAFVGATSKCIFGSTFGGTKIDSGGVKLILTCLDTRVELILPP
jgi:hypothetical protein